MDKPIDSIAFIMDGNRRWAANNRLFKNQGHEKGLDNLMNVLDWCTDQQINSVAVYALSTENWERDESEVAALMNLFRYMLQNKIDDLIEKGARVRFVGEISAFPTDLQNMIKDAEEKTNNNKKTLWICASYGGRAEIRSAALEYRKSDGSQSFESFLWTNEMPDPELIIRTGGDQRLSNFLLWKAAYSELFFTETLWPAFEKSEFLDILETYKKKVRINKGK